MIDYSSDLPLEQSFLALPALREGIRDANGQVGVDEDLWEIGVVAGPQTEGMSFHQDGLTDCFVDRCKVYPVPLGLLMQLNPSGADVVDGEGDGGCDTSGDEKGKGVNPSPLSEPGEETLLEVVVGSSDRHVVQDVPPDVDLQSLEGFTRTTQLPQCFKGGGGVPSAPLLVDLWVEDLPDGDDGEGMGDDSAGCTGDGCDDCLFSVAEVVVGLCRLDLVVDERVNGVTHEQVAESAPQMRLESLEDTT